MKNALFSGSIIGIVSLIWIFIAQKLGFYPENLKQNQIDWMVYSVLLIPFLGLYFGIRNYKKRKRTNLCFTEAVFEGFKILAIGGLFVTTYSVIYMISEVSKAPIDFMELAILAIGIGLFFTFVNALLLATSKN